MAQVPSCTDTQLELLRKILLQFQEMATVEVPASYLPLCADSSWDLYRKILLTLDLI